MDERRTRPRTRSRPKEIARRREISFLYTIPTFPETHTRTIRNNTAGAVSLSSLSSTACECLEDNQYVSIGFEAESPPSVHELERAP